MLNFGASKPGIKAGPGPPGPPGSAPVVCSVIKTIAPSRFFACILEKNVVMFHKCGNCRKG